MEIWTALQNDEQHNLEYEGWNTAYRSLEAAQEAVAQEAAEMAGVAEVGMQWSEVAEGRWIGIADGDPIDGKYAVVRTTLQD
jgi:hypothetical protein